MQSYLAPPQKVLEDPLAYLPCGPVTEYRRGETIYCREQPATRIYTVIDGMVKVCRTPAGGRKVMMDVYQPDDFFGESALLGNMQPAEMAIALEMTKLMSWSTEDIESLATARPRLAIGLLQLELQRSMDLQIRIASFAANSSDRRLALSLLRFSSKLGRRFEDGSVHMIAFSHEVLAEYVGTSREIVTHYMNLFRSLGYLDYSRKGILLHPDAFTEFLNGRIPLCA